MAATAVPAQGWHVKDDDDGHWLPEWEDTLASGRFGLFHIISFSLSLYLSRSLSLSISLSLSLSRSLSLSDTQTHFFSFCSPLAKQAPDLHHNCM